MNGTSMICDCCGKPIEANGYLGDGQYCSRECVRSGKFRLPEEDERVRAMLFPEKTPLQYVEFVRSKQAEFSALPEETQARLRASVERIGNMTLKLRPQQPAKPTKQQEIAAFAAQVMQAAMRSGLMWDEAVAGLGLAAKAMADGAASQGDGSLDNCIVHARKRLDEGFAQRVELIQTVAPSAATH